MKQLTARIVAAYVRANRVPATELPALIEAIYHALADAGREPTAPESVSPAVPIRKSVAPDHIVCLDCGKPMRMLKRHLSTDHGLTPDEYRAKWGLAADYPIVAPNYAAQRSALAKKAGLGTKRKGTEPPATPPAEAGGSAPAGFRYPANRWAKPTSE